MALIVEDGTGKNDATSFVSRAEYIAYGAARGVTIPDEDAADVDLVKAMDFILTKCFRGDPTVADQALPFPRHVEDYYGVLEFADDAVPTAIKRAQMDAGLAVRDGVSLLPNVAASSSSIKREKVGPIETEYETAMAYDSPTLPAISAALRPFECGQGARIRTLRV